MRECRTLSISRGSIIATLTPRPSTALTLTGYFSFVLIGCNAVLVPSLIRSIEGDFHQSDAAFGLFYLVSALVYASGSFSGGFLIERLGRRTVLATSGFLCALGLCCEAAAPSWPLFLLAAIPVNWGAGAIDGGVNGLFLDLYQRARGGALNLLHFYFGVGALVAPFVVGHMVAAGVSWRIGLLATGAGAMALGLLMTVLPIPSGVRSRVAMPDEYTGREGTLLPFAGLAAGICCYVTAEVAVSGWLVKFLSDVPVTSATAALSLFWAGLAGGRLLSNWVAEKLNYVEFTVGCISLASITLAAALLVRNFPVSVVLFTVSGAFYGPIYPMIMAIGGNLYPHRIAALSGSLGAAAVVGSIVYPPLIGIMSAHIGLRAGLLGAGVLGLPAALAIVGVQVVASRPHRDGRDSDPAIGAP